MKIRKNGWDNVEDGTADVEVEDKDLALLKRMLWKIFWRYIGVVASITIATVGTAWKISNDVGSTRQLVKALYESNQELRAEVKSLRGEVSLVKLATDENRLTIAAANKAVESRDAQEKEERNLIKVRQSEFERELRMSGKLR